MIKTIIFDNQGVLTDKDEDGTLQTMSKHFKFDYDKVKPIYLECRDKIDVGEMTSEDFYEAMRKNFEGIESTQPLKDLHLKIYEIRPEVVEYVKELKKSYNIALLTNFNDSFHTFNQRWKLDEFIPKENIFISCELKMKKPDSAFFLYALKALGNKPEECVFVDDVLRNVEAAEKVGMKGIQFTTLENLKKDLSGILEPINA